MIRILASLRYAVIVAVVCSFVSAFLMLFVGAEKVYKAVEGFVTGTGDVLSQGTDAERVLSHLSQGDAAIARVIESVDAFLVALVMMYFGYGVYSLFFIKESESTEKAFPLRGIPRDIGEMKETLTHIILVVLFVLFARVVWLNLDDLQWELLVLPAAIALLALALKLAELRHSSKEEKSK